MSTWLQVVASDLRAFAGVLLEPGLAPARSAGSGTGLSVDNDVQVAARFLIRNWESLLREVREEEEADWTSTIYRRSPRRALVPRRGSQYFLLGNDLVPVRFEVATTRDQLNPPALRWLTHIVEVIEQKVAVRLDRLEQWLEGFRPGSASLVDFAFDSERLLRSHRDLLRTIIALRGRLREEAAGLTSSRQPPTPFPRGRTWRLLRECWNQVTSPALSRTIRGLLSEPVEVADAPFLFQRWCCLKLIQAFRDQGWSYEGDIVGILFLGGCLNLRRSTASLEVWVESRIGTVGGHPSGARCVVRGTRSPDVLVSFDGLYGRRDICVLDATLVSDPVQQQDKCRKYREDLVVDDFHTIAGVPVVARPLRSWLMALDSAPHARVFDPEGRTGVLPMNPPSYFDAPIKAWVSDVTRRATAASLLRADLPAEFERS